MILCHYEKHDIVKGITWSNDMRYDACKRKGCKFSYWVLDLEHSKLIKFRLKLFQEKRRVLFEKAPKMKDDIKSFLEYKEAMKSIGAISFKETANRIEYF